MKLEVIKVEEAIGKPLLHDITGTFKDKHHQKETIFKKNHTITKDDVELLKSSGKYHVYVCDDISEMLHEDDAAYEFARLVMNDKLTCSSVSEGKINILSKHKGILKVDKAIVNKLNERYDITLATKATYSFVQENDIIASFRIIDLFIDRDIVKEMFKLVNDRLFEIQKIETKRVKLLTVGTEIYEKKVEDLSLAKMNDKLEKYNLKVDNQEFLIDEKELIKTRIIESANDYDMIICTGGMSVDPDDFTKKAILEVSDKVICDHTPYLPGSMFVMTTINKSVIFGCPANVVFNEKTVLDIVLNRVLIDELPSTKDIMLMGYGALK